MAENFQDLKKKFIEFHSRVKNQDEFSAAFNKLSNNKELREIIASMQENFPKEPSLGDKYTMVFTYAQLLPENRSKEDCGQWWKHTKDFINSCPRDAQYAGHLQFTLNHIPEIQTKPSEAHIYALRVINLLPKKFAGYEDCVKTTEKIGRTYYKDLLNQACAEKDYQKQIKAFDKVLAILPRVPAGERYKRLDECIQAMTPVYQHSEWGRLELPRKRKLAAKRIFKSMPLVAKNIISQNNNRNNWLSK